MLKITKSLCIAGLIFLTGCATTPPIPEENKTFNKIVEAKGKTKDEIYISAKSWLAETFKSSKAVIEVDSKEDGLIIGNGIIPYPCTGLECMGREGWKVPFTMKIEIKENKFKMTFSNILLSTPGQAGVYPPSTNPIYRQGDLDKIKPELLKLTEQLSIAITKKEESKDW